MKDEKKRFFLHPSSFIFYPIPFAFGKKRETGKRGCSDHLPVTVRLKVVP